MKQGIALLAALAAIPLATALGAPVAAGLQSAEPELINNANPASFQVYGVAPAPKSIKDESVEGGRALPVAMSGVGTVYASGVNVPIVKAVRAGDAIDIYYWARLEAGGPETASIASAQLQLSGAPYTRIFGTGSEITPAWKLFHVAGIADKDYAKGTLNAAFHLNTGKHVVLLGPVAVLRK